ncbi:MAG: phosphotransferase [Nitrospinae bacterium]|nr:phosphotransferase [Nitrospinota bacterium]
MTQPSLTLGQAARLVSLAGFPESQLEIIPLAGDASTRRYYRVVHPNGSVVIMQTPEKGQTAHFMAMTSLMNELAVDTPKILGGDGPFLVLEDLGDNLLQNHISAMAEDELEAEYSRILHDLVRFQLNANRLDNKNLPPYILAFDVEKLTWEVEFANTHFVGGHLGFEMSVSMRNDFMAEWKMVIEDLAGRMETLAHRDLHCRNIMAVEKRRVWIDYQDARMGRMLYDLASLLYDPYAGLSPNLVNRLGDIYYDALKTSGAALWPKDRFMELLEFSTLQRIYKALGTYGYQTSVRGVSTYVPYIAPSMKTLLEVSRGSLRAGKIAGMLKEIFSAAKESRGAV